MSRRGASFASAVAAVAFAAVVAFPASAYAAGPDEWLGKDKSLHFAASSAISAGGYATGAVVFKSRTSALIAGGVLSAVAGIAKETRDLAGYGDPSWRDLAWDGIGLVTGLASAFSVDVALRSPSGEQRLRIAPAVDQRAAGFQARMTF
jgi:putative lipoprotein